MGRGMNDYKEGKAVVSISMNILRYTFSEAGTRYKKILAIKVIEKLKQVVHDNTIFILN